MSTDDPWIPVVPGEFPKEESFILFRISEEDRPIEGQFATIDIDDAWHNKPLRGKEPVVITHNNDFYHFTNGHSWRYTVVDADD